MTESARPPRGGCTRENCALVAVIDSHGAQLKSMAERVESIEARKTGHEARLTTLEATQKITDARVDRAESSVAETSRALHELKGEVHGLKVVVTTVSVTSESTYQMLKDHVANYARDLESYTVRIERQSQKIARVAAWISAGVVLLAMIHSAVSGQSLPSLIMNLLSGIGL